MGVVGGFHVEGGDHLILKCFIAKIGGFDDTDIVEIFVEAPSRGWEDILHTMPAAIQKFYRKCAQFAVIGIDNDGTEDLTHSGKQEAAGRPRHWNHSTPQPNCRYCRLQAIADKERARLTPLPQKPPASWPILIAVPVESIEAWLLELQAIHDPKRGMARAEYRSRAQFKSTLYGAPVATRERVEQIALPLIREATPQQIAVLRQRCRSFDLFAEQIDKSLPIINGTRDCWFEGDKQSER